MDTANVGEEMYRFVTDLFPICRSITGKGARETLALIQKHAPLDIHEIPSGTRVFDWIVPKEWNIREAWIKDPAGKKIIDFQNSNLHVLNYSTPVHARLSLKDLKENLYSLPEHPDWIPYRTSYYNNNWGFCLSHNQLLGLSEGEYEVFVDSSLEDGHLTFGECYLRGETEAEVLISTHICHPSLANDNLSGIAGSNFSSKIFEQAFIEIFLPISFYPGNHWLDHLAQLKRISAVPNQTRAGTDMCRGQGKVYV